MTSDSFFFARPTELVHPFPLLDFYSNLDHFFWWTKGEVRSRHFRTERTSDEVIERMKTIGLMILYLMSISAVDGQGTNADVILGLRSLYASTNGECDRPLTSMYSKSEGDRWFRNDNWMTGTDFCTFYGVQCQNFFGLLFFGLFLDNNNLGTSSFLSSCRSHNLIDGFIPADLGKANPSLAYISAGFNKLRGPIPDSIFNQNGYFQGLNLSYNALSGTSSPSIDVIDLKMIDHTKVHSHPPSHFQRGCRSWTFLRIF